MKMLIDSHCHLEDWIQAQQLDALLEAAAQNRVKSFVTVGTRPYDWSLYRSTALQYPMIKFTAGLHPTEIGQNWEEQLAQLPQFLTEAVAIGEIGLDFHDMPADELERAVYAKTQMLVFEKQLRLAQQFNLPVVIHCREAFEVLIEVLQYVKFDFHRVLFHCFVEGPQAAEWLVSKGAFLSYSGIVSFKNAQVVRDSLALTPLHQLLVETDSPFLAPVPHRGKKNSPVFLLDIAQLVAELRGIGLDELCESEKNNAQTFFQTQWNFC